MAALEAAAARTARAGTLAGAGHPTVWLDGLPQGNPPRALAFKLKAALELTATPTLVITQGVGVGTAALLLPGNEGDAARLRDVAFAHDMSHDHDGMARRLLELGLGPSVRLALRGGGAAHSAATAAAAEHQVDKRPWGAFVMQRSADSNLAPSAPSAPPPEPETVHGIVVSETAKLVLRGGGTDPKGLTVARGGFDDHTADGAYLCAGCHSPLYGSETKWDCGCGWPGFWGCKKDALYEQRDGARGEIRCTTCDGHIGHVYRGEGYDNPPPNERHCANSSALVFQPVGGASLVRPGYAGAVYMSTTVRCSNLP